LSTTARIDRREDRTARRRWRTESAGRPRWHLLARLTEGLPRATGLTEPTPRLAKASTRLAEAASGLAESSARLTEASSRLPERLPRSTTGSAAHPGPRKSRPAGTRLRGCCQVDERPLVVAVHPVIELDGRVLALRRDTLDAHRGLRGLTERRRWRGPWSGARLCGSAAAGRPHAARRIGRSRSRAGCWHAGTSAGHSAAYGNDLEIVVRDRVLVLLPQEFLLDQDVDGRGEGVRVASLEEHDGAPVLLAAPNELFFLLALGEVAPDRQRGGHQHGHHAHAHEQGRHGVAPLVSSTALTG